MHGVLKWLLVVVVIAAAAIVILSVVAIFTGGTVPKSAIE